jgi:D-glycero-alpha-D-manno-heptose 1-phosphate guanylyltransferase
MIQQAIILAGGLGTRLRSAVPDLPKCMAPVAGKPFLDHVITYFSNQGIKEYILALGYKSEIIIDYIRQTHPTLAVKFSIETQQLGTGGAIRLACELASTENVLVLNGDTIFKIDLQKLSSFHEATGAECSVVLKPMHNFDRYGVVEISPEKRITSFREKQFYAKGLINGGVYSLNPAALLQRNLPEKFSFEKDYLEAFSDQGTIFGQVQDEYFIDIGIPADYDQAQKDFN